MKDLIGDLISGQNVDESLSFTLNHIKQLETQSILNKTQLTYINLLRM